MFDIVPCTAKRVKVDPAFVEEVRTNFMFRAFTHSCFAALCAVPLLYSMSFYLLVLSSRPPLGFVMMCWWISAALLVLANALLAGSFYSAARRRIIVEVAAAGGIVYVLTNGNKWKDYGSVHGYGVTDGGRQLTLEFERRPWSYPHVIAFVPDAGMDAEACKSLLGIALPTSTSSSSTLLLGMNPRGERRNRASHRASGPEQLSPTSRSDGVCSIASSVRSREMESDDELMKGKLGCGGEGNPFGTSAYSTVSIKTMINEQNLEQV